MAIERYRRQRIAEINVVPYIDVMLVLLVIFMITAPLMNPGQIDLPSVGKSLTPPVAPIEVIIRKDSSLAVNDRNGAGGEQNVTRSDLLTFLKKRQTAHPDQPVVISADKNVRYEEVIAVMDMLQRQHVRKVGLLVQSN